MSDEKRDLVHGSNRLPQKNELQISILNRLLQKQDVPKGPVITPGKGTDKFRIGMDGLDLILEAGVADETLDFDKILEAKDDARTYWVFDYYQELGVEVELTRNIVTKLSFKTGVPEGGLSPRTYKPYEGRLAPTLALQSHIEEVLQVLGPPLRQVEADPELHEVLEMPITTTLQYEGLHIECLSATGQVLHATVEAPK